MLRKRIGFFNCYHTKNDFFAPAAELIVTVFYRVLVTELVSESALRLTENNLSIVSNCSQSM
jgi:hypothetical protein